MYEVCGDGPALLMYAPGGFDARIEQWSALGVYKRIKLLDHLPRKYKCIVFDRRENGQSGGRVERITWNHFVRQGIGLLAAVVSQAADRSGLAVLACDTHGLAQRGGVVSSHIRLGEDALTLEPCPLCAPNIPGFRWPVAPAVEVVRAVKAAIGEPESRLYIRQGLVSHRPVLP